MKSLHKMHVTHLQKCIMNAKNSKDPSTQCGAVLLLADGHRTVSGWNRFLDGTPTVFWEDREKKYAHVLHAEVDVITKAISQGYRTQGSTLYGISLTNDGQIFGGPPCIRCTVTAIAAGITTFVAPIEQNVPERWKESLNQSRNLIGRAGLTYIETAHK